MSIRRAKRVLLVLAACLGITLGALPLLTVGGKGEPRSETQSGEEPPQSSGKEPPQSSALLQPRGEEELDRLALYELRDRVFRGTPGGRRATELFYEHIGDMAAATASEPAVAGLALDWLLSWQGVLRELVDAGGGDAALTQDHVDTLRAYVDALADAGSPELREALEREAERMGIDGWAGTPLDDWLDGPVNRLSCADGERTICLLGGRFRVDVGWQTPQGRRGFAHSVRLSPDAAYFYFRNEDNIELVVKMLEGCGGNFDAFWVFAAGLTNVEVRLIVTDTLTGTVREYLNEQGQTYVAIQDTGAFATCGAAGAAVRGAPGAEAAADRAASTTSLVAALDRGSAMARRTGRGTTTRPVEPRLVERGTPCTATEEALCLTGDRFQVAVDWARPGADLRPATAVELTDDSGYFYFRNADNIELVVKVLDACSGASDRFWVFSAGLTNLQVALTVTDTESGLERVYSNEQGNPYVAVQDTNAFPTCP